ncbi:MAG: insulinase family protein, partial [Ferruginibacter sp.]|nr:insulinase family protein [Ferruginibacter sp.]
MNRKSAPKITEAVNFTLNLKPYETLVLDNGVKVYAINEGPQDIIQIEIVFSAGNWFENKNGIAGATNFMLKNGTTQKTALQINEAFEYYGTFCSRHCYNETATLSLHTLTKYLHHLLPVMQELISDSVFPENELELFKQNSLQKLTVNLRNAEFVAGRLIDSYVYGENHPYGIYTRPDTLEQLTVEELKLFYNQYYLNGEAVLFVSGNLPEKIFELLNNNFGKLSLKPATFHYPAKVATPSIVKKYRIENDKTSVQGAIRLAQPFPNRHHPDFKKVMLLNCLF